MKINAEHLLPLILDFLGSHFGEEDLQAFKDHFNITV
jgi:hypothetical protein